MKAQRAFREVSFMEPSDRSLIERCLAGETDAFGELVRRYRERIYFTAYRMTGNHSEADDLTQEAFLRAYRSLKRFGGRSSFYSWLYRIAVNVCLNHLNRWRRRAPVLLNPLDPLSEKVMGESGDDPSAQAQEGELRTALAEALRSLSPKHRAAFVLHEFEGLSGPEIASVLRCSEGTVRSRLHYAREKLKKKLRRFAEDNESV